jgi:hypothetical protein
MASARKISECGSVGRALASGARGPRRITNFDYKINESGHSDT